MDGKEKEEGAKEKKESEYDEEEEFEQTNEMKQYRQVLFAMGKFIKYSIWVCTAFFFYHYYLAFYKDKPEEAFLANEGVLNYAFAAKFAYQDLVKLLTRPPVDSLLLERPPA